MAITLVQPHYVMIYDVPLVGALFPTSRYGKTKTPTGVAISPSALAFLWCEVLRLGETHNDPVHY
jgi:hypothetical protein